MNRRDFLRGISLLPLCSLPIPQASEARGFTVPPGLPDDLVFRLHDDYIVVIPEEYYPDGVPARIQDLTTSLEKLAASFAQMGDAATQAAAAFERFGEI